MILASIAVLAWVSSGWAWMTHLEWKRTGEYGRNSLPMNMVARDGAIGAGVLTAATIGLGIWLGRRKPERNEKR